MGLGLAHLPTPVEPLDRLTNGSEAPGCWSSGTT